jgi:Holliday junction resolvase
VSTYSQGRSFEYTVRRHLIDHGATNVTRSPMSRGPWDVRADIKVLDGSTRNLYIQCKATADGYVCPEEWNRLYDYAESRGGLALVAHKKTSSRGVCYKLIEGRKLKRRKQPWMEWEL